MIDYKAFLKSTINPNHGISEFTLDSEIFQYYGYLNEKKIESLEKEYVNQSIQYYELEIWASLLLLFNQRKLLKHIIIKDKNIVFENYYIGMTFDEAMRLPVSVYDINDDEDSIFHSLYKGIKFNLDLNVKDELFIGSIEVFDCEHKGM
ncbi:hypothetical protein HUK80_13490 [Flavobacterium sp. MAH-1]|uniref:Uncharacterized protein n=1 Tax=Flavobacterium agri TaxID=2743471 RepID=A0A7Y8Y3N3_9FLAO|nr:hypothetical protein [Flavobacterium agri]NUY81912.1 hypothetical protein [Flavobacterium agri]NYA71936.1 hypothetical protein [Flavobacterium agri]